MANRLILDENVLSRIDYQIAGQIPNSANIIFKKKSFQTIGSRLQKRRA